MPPDIEAIAEQVFTALADPTRRATLASAGPATATDLADCLPVTRQAIAKHLALLAEAGRVRAEPGERRRVRYRLRSAPMQVADQFLAALARDWDRPLEALTEHLDRSAREPTTTPVEEARAQPCLITDSHLRFRRGPEPDGSLRGHQHHSRMRFQTDRGPHRRDPAPDGYDAGPTPRPR